MMYLMGIAFPLLAIGCSLWIATAMVTYVLEIQRDIRADKSK